jgi:uncharacterized protein YndB with AHSA1/START domain
MSPDRELWITHVFDAPRDLVFKAWTDPVHLARWSGPRGFTASHSTMDIRPGGAFRSCLRSPEGVEHWVRGIYREIVEPERLVFTHAWEDSTGTPGLETLVTITFADHGRKTSMTFHQAIFASIESRDGHQGGWTSSFERLGAYLVTLRAGETTA